jgi:hypothetical protein
MLRLRLGSEYLDLSPSVAVTLTVHNPLFDQDGAEALYSFPFSLPATPRNRSLLSYANRLDNSSNITTYTDAVLEIEGVPFDNGVLELDEQKFTRDEIGVVYRNLVPALLDDLERIRIHEILETVQASFPQPKAVWKFDLLFSAPNTFAITIDGNVITYAAAAGETPAQIVTGLSNAIDAIFPGMSYNPSGNTQLQLESDKVNQHPILIFSLVGLGLVSVVTTGQARQTGFQNRVAEINATPVASHCFPMLHWLNFYKGNNRRTYTSYINAAVGGNLINNQPSADPSWATTFIPMVKLPYVFDRITDFTSLVTIWDGYFDDADVQELILFNNRAVDQLIEDIYEISVDNTTKFINGYQSTINLNKHVPEMTAKELLERFIAVFGLWYKITGTTVTFVKKADQLTGTPIDWTDKSEPDYTATRNKREGYTLEYDDSEDEFESNTQLVKLVVGEGKEIITLPFHTVHYSSQPAYVVNAQLKLPIINQAGSSTEGGLGNNPFSFRLFFDRGMQPASNSQTYSFASHDYTNYAGSPVGALSLDINDPGGIYEQNHKVILELTNNGQPVTITMRLSVADILTARKWDNARRVVKLPDGQVNAVIKSMQFKASSQGIGLSLVELIQEK